MLARLTHLTCPGRSATRSVALQTRDLSTLRFCEDPGSAVHHFASLRAAPHPGNVGKAKGGEA